MSATYEEIREELIWLPDRLSSARRARGLSLREAAAEIGLSYSTLNRIENGEATNISVFSALTVLYWLSRQTH